MPFKSCEPRPKKDEDITGEQAQPIAQIPNCPGEDEGVESVRMNAHFFNIAIISTGMQQKSSDGQN